jgi:hypothetical protein
MRSFAILTAVLSLSAFSWAAPTPAARAELKRDGTLPVGAVNGLPVTGSVGDGVLKRDTLPVNGIPVAGSDVYDVLKRGGPQNFEGIFTGLLIDLYPLTEQLSYVNEHNATVEFISPICDRIIVILGDAIYSVNALIGKPIETVLATVDGVLTTAQVAKLVADVIKLVVVALGVVLRVVATVARLPVVAILCAVLTIVGKLVAAVLVLLGGVLTGLLITIVHLIHDVLPIILELNVESVIKILCL